MSIKKWLHTKVKGLKLFQAYGEVSMDSANGSSLAMKVEVHNPTINW